MSDKRPTVRQRRADLEAREAERREAVVQELEAIASGEATDVIQWDAMGQVTLTPSDQLPARARRSVKKVKVTPTRMGNAIEVEMHDKVSALRMLSQHHGLLTPGLEKSDRPSVIGINMTGPVVTDYEEKDGEDKSGE